MKYYHLSWWLCLVCLVLCACGGDSDSTATGGEEPELTTESGASLYTLKGYVDASQGYNVLSIAGWGDDIYLKEQLMAGKNITFQNSTAARLDAMGQPALDGEWNARAAVNKGQAYWVRHEGKTLYQFLKLRIIGVSGNNVQLEYLPTDITSEIPNTARHEYGLEVPALNEANILVQHKVDYSGKSFDNLTLEWIPSLRHANWVAFTFDTYTSLDNVSRTDAWAWDPLIPASQGGVEETHHKSDGFDKGHLCASEDRVYCKEANEQTFYYSNISPQLNEFNSGFWMFLENRVRTWGRSTQRGTFDKLYVVKGGSMNQLLKNFSGKNKGMDGITPTTDAQGLTPKGLACPAYYFMAVLAERNGSYQAIGFWVEHGSDLPKEPTADQLKAKALSIDELENLTNLDLFCNLPAGVEEGVEASLTLTDWAW